MEINMLNFDTKLFYAINGLANKSEIWDQIFIIAARYSIVIFSAILVIYFFKKRQIFWMAAFSALLSRGFFTEALRYLYHRPRPFVALEQVNYLDTANLIFELGKKEPSFPSGHAAFMFAIALAVWLYDKKIGGILILTAVVLSVARVYVGVHYPLDILGGILIAVLSIFLVKKVVRNRI